MATQAERSASTRSAVVDAARAQFAARGYEHVSVADILRAAGVSRGALYHHFAGKADVFAAVFVTVATDAIRAAARHIPRDASSGTALRAGCLGWLDVVDDPAIGQILFVDAPNALGWERARALEELFSLGVVRRGIAAAIRAGELAPVPVDLAARMINAMLTEAALVVRQGAAAPEEAAAVVSSLFDSLLRH